MHRGPPTPSLSSRRAPSFLLSKASFRRGPNLDRSLPGPGSLADDLPEGDRWRDGVRDRERRDAKRDPFRHALLPRTSGEFGKKEGIAGVVVEGCTGIEGEVVRRRCVRGLKIWKIQSGQPTLPRASSQHSLLSQRLPLGPSADV